MIRPVCLPGALKVYATVSRTDRRPRGYEHSVPRVHERQGVPLAGRYRSDSAVNRTASPSKAIRICSRGSARVQGVGKSGRAAIPALRACETSIGEAERRDPYRRHGDRGACVHPMSKNGALNVQAMVLDSVKQPQASGRVVTWRLITTSARRGSSREPADSSLWLSRKNRLNQGKPGTQAEESRQHGQADIAHRHQRPRISVDPVRLLKVRRALKGGRQ